MSQSVPSFIPETIGGKDVIFDDAPIIGTVEFYDGVILYVPPILFLMLSDTILPWFLEPFSLVFFGMFVALSSSLLVLKPKYLTVKEWIQLRRDYSGRDHEYKKNLMTDGGRPIDSYEVTPDDDTRKLTQVKKTYPAYNVVELTDGTMIKILSFSGSNLDMASGDIMQNIVNNFSRQVSSGLHSDIQFYMPMRSINLEATKDMYKDRIGELDNGIGSEKSLGDQFMLSYLNDRLNYVSNIGDGASIREQYVIVPLKRSEIYNQGLSGESSGLEKLPAGDLLSDIKRGVTGGSQIQSKKELQRTQLREIENRTETVGNTLAVGPGNSYRPLECAEMLALLREFWEGEQITSEEMPAFENEIPFITGGDSDD